MTTKNYTYRIQRLFTMMLCICSTLFYTKAEAMTKTFWVNMYGHMLEFNLEADFYATRSEWINGQSLQATTNELLANNQIDTFIKQLDRHKTSLQMDDMAYLLLLNKTLNSLLPNESDDYKLLLKYVILQQKGFDVFVGYSPSHLTLYGRTNFMIDNCLYIERGTKKYFDLSFSQKREPEQEQLFVIRHQGKALPLVMNMVNPPAFKAKTTKKVTPFEYDGFVYFFTTNVNQSLVEYYRELPTINISTVYLNYGLSQSATHSLISEMQKATAGMKTSQSVDFLLKFVQHSFEYKNDAKVYGQEKFSFPEETLLNSYSDCEDKAMLFAVLVNKVLGLKTVALFYKDAEHINVAVETWRKDLKGNISFNNHNYIVCEPSGKGFAIGESATQVNIASLIDW